MTLTARDRKEINKGLRVTSSSKHSAIPMYEITNVLEAHGCVILQEDNTKWSGFFCGEEAQVYFNLAPIESKDEMGMYTPFKNAQLTLYWYRFRETERYEILTYIG